MIDFEEELKKFHPSLEIDEAEDAIKHHDFSDLTDVMLQIQSRENRPQERQ